VQHEDARGGHVVHAGRWLAQRLELAQVLLVEPVEGLRRRRERGLCSGQVLLYALLVRVRVRVRVRLRVRVRVGVGAGARARARARVGVRARARVGVGVGVRVGPCAPSCG
jgi:hypothetical protein